MTILATVIAGYTAAVLMVPGFGPPFLIERRELMPWALNAHLAGGLVALAIGAWQFNTRIRLRFLNLHRWMGRGYVIAVMVGGLGAMAMVRVSLHGMVTHVGFGLLAGLWLFTTLQGYRRILAHDQVGHRQWMIRSYSLTLAAVTLRVYIPLGMSLGMSFADVYQTVAWLCWVPNLIVAEWVVLRPATGSL